jgi:lipoate-protein ligase B
MIEIIVRKLGQVCYAEGLEIQLDARSRVLDGAPDELLLLEHSPVVTLGRRGGEIRAGALETLDTEVIQTDRGGLATWHGPGQLVGYPIVDLARRGLDITTMVNRLGYAMRDVCINLGLKDLVYDPDRPGVYREGKKIGAIGMHIHRGVTTHGFALNVDCDLRGFRAIVACGQAGMETTSLAVELGRSIAMESVMDGIQASLDLSGA